MCGEARKAIPFARLPQALSDTYTAFCTVVTRDHTFEVSLPSNRTLLLVYLVQCCCSSSGLRALIDLSNVNTQTPPKKPCNQKCVLVHNFEFFFFSSIFTP